MRDIEAAAIPVSFKLNGQSVSLLAPPLKRLLDVLRHDLGLVGTKNGCGEGDCGSCTVLIDGLPVVSCLVPIVQVDGATVRTVESLAESGRLHPLQQALADTGGAQCGGCLGGFQMAACGYLESAGCLEPADCLESAGHRESASVLESVDNFASRGVVASRSVDESHPTRDAQPDGSVLGDARLPNVEEAELRRAVAGVLCRCTGYQRMIEALRQVASGGG